MKIKSLHIKNFRSLQSLVMDDIGGITILVGANSCGKTNILDALTLFFDQLSPEMQRNIGSIPDYTWFDRESASPIEFDLTIELNSGEAGKILADESVRAQLQREDSNYIRLVQRIEGTPSAATWTIQLVEINGKTIHGENLETDAEEKPLVAPENLSKMLQDFTAHFKGKFIFIPASRDTTASYTGFNPRTLILHSNLLGELRTLAQRGGRAERARWRKLRGFISRVSPAIEDMRVLDGDFTFGERESGSDFPICWVGGGHQELLMLIYQLVKQPNAVFGIDEPEVHLHPQLARRFLEVLKEITKNQQIFLATQSPIFIDRADLSNVWLIKKVKGTTEITRLREIEDLKDIVTELGIRPSDIFYANTIVFVEGPSDQIALSILAQKVGVDLEAEGVSIIPTHGKSRGKYHLGVFIEASRAANTPFFMILDKGAGRETKQFIKDGTLKDNENLFFLKEGDFEDYYPREKLINALSSELNIEITPEEKEKLLKGSAVKIIEDTLKSKLQEALGRRWQESWKVRVSRKAAEDTSVTEIPDELRGIIGRIALKVRPLS